MDKLTNHPWEISSKQFLFDLKLNDIWNYRDLLFLLVRRDFVTFYKQTVLGPVWFFLQPLFTTIVFNFVFSKLASISTDGLPGPLFYMAGITIWNYFSDCTIKTSSVFRDNTDLFGKVYFPRLIMPLSIVISNLMRFSMQFLMFITMILYYTFRYHQLQPNIYVLLAPLLIILMAALGLGLGMTISSLTTKYRDLAFLLSFGIQLFMYATPVIMPFSAIPSKYKWLVQLNPMTHIVEAFRYGFLGRGCFAWSSLGYATLLILVVLVIGVLVFNKVEKNFIDTV